MRSIDADALKQHIDKQPALPDGNYAGNHSALKALINMQPTIEPEPHWIPCSERLPDKEGRYLVWAVMSFVPDYVDEPNTYQGTTIASYFKRLRPFKWFGDHVEQVIAWMPLPKPYMRGEQT